MGNEQRKNIKIGVPAARKRRMGSSPQQSISVVMNAPSVTTHGGSDGGRQNGSAHLTTPGPKGTQLLKNPPPPH